MLIEPKFSTILTSPQWEHIVSTGAEAEQRHRYMAFFAPESREIASMTDSGEIASMPDRGEIASILDLSSMQFREVGRGPGKEGKMLFVLEEKTEYEERLERIAGSVDLDWREIGIVLDQEFAGSSIVRKVKERWEKRDTEKWCGHCGAPEPKFKRAGCGDVWFCNKAHQKMMWSFHKGYCNKG